MAGLVTLLTWQWADLTVIMCQSIGRNFPLFVGVGFV
jgi:hypothetical protein